MIVLVLQRPRPFLPPGRRRVEHLAGANVDAPDDAVDVHAALAVGFKSVVANRCPAAARGGIEAGVDPALEVVEDRLNLFVGGIVLRRPGDDPVRIFALGISQVPVGQAAHRERIAANDRDAGPLLALVIM